MIDIPTLNQVLVQHVRKNPVIVGMIVGEDAAEFFERDYLKNKLTLARKDSIFSGFKLPTVGILEIDNGYGIKECFLCAVVRKQKNTSFDTRITIESLIKINLESLSSFNEHLSGIHKTNYSNKLQNLDFHKLSPELSVEIISLLFDDESNHDSLEKIAQTIKLTGKHDPIVWLQHNAIDNALKVFGVDADREPTNLLVRSDSFSNLSNLNSEIHAYEDNLIASDIANFGDFEFLSRDITGRAVFEKGDQKLTLITANRLPLEEMLGVDLIYINELTKSIVMVQYKMLEQSSDDWVYRPNSDRNFADEIARMQIPSIVVTDSSYRMCVNPFYFKFVKRKQNANDDHTSFILSLEHLKLLLSDPSNRGPRDGLKIGFEALKGCYLRETEFFGLIRSGYIGTKQSATDALRPFIEQAQNGNKAIVLAWQQLKDQANFS